MAAPPKLMDAAWRSFAEQVLPIDAPDVQRQEMRRAFYAGGWAFYTALMGNLDGGDDPTAADFSMLDGLDRELRDFAEQVQSGRA